jgi:ribose transport system permease protein
MRTRMYWHFRALLSLALAVVTLVLATALIPGFAGAGNIYALLQSLAVLSLVAAGLAVTMIAGEFDLSVAGTFPLAGIVAVAVADRLGALVGVLVSVGVLLVLGLLNGWLVARFGISSLAITVGTMVFAIGLGFAVADGHVVAMHDFGAGAMLEEPLLGIFSLRSLVSIILLVLLAVVVGRTWFGGFLRSTGADRKRAGQLGTPVRRTLVAAFLISGFATGIGGSLQGIALASGAPGANEGFLLSAVTAAIVGGVAQSGGVGTIPGVVAGALLLSVIGNGLSLAGTSAAAIQLANGLILLIVVLVDRPLQQALLRGVGRAPRAPARAPGDRTNPRSDNRDGVPVTTTQ